MRPLLKTLGTGALYLLCLGGSGCDVSNLPPPPPKDKAFCNVTAVPCATFKYKQCCVGGTCVDFCTPPGFDPVCFDNSDCVLPIGCTGVICGGFLQDPASVTNPALCPTIPASPPGAGDTVCFHHTDESPQDACGDLCAVFGGGLNPISRSRFFEYHSQVRAPLCPTLLAWLDRHAEVIGGKIGLTLDADDPYRYYKFRDGAAFAADSGGCPPENGACALGDAVYSSTSFHAHEQAHDYVFRAWGGWSNGLFSEGEAVALSCMPFYELEPGQRPVDVVGALDWRDLLNLFGDSDEGYGAAGFFVTYLAERYGWQSVQALHRKVRRGAAAAEVARAFADVYPTSIDQAWADVLGTAGAAPCQRDWQCLATSMAVGEVAAPECDGEMHRSVDVGAQGGAVLTVEGDDSRLMLLPCAAATPTSYTLDGSHAGRPATHWASLPPGAYAMFPGPLPASVALRSYFQGPLVGSACASAGLVSLDANGRTSIDLPRGWRRRMDAPRRRRPHVRRVPLQPGVARPVDSGARVDLRRL